MKKRAFAIFGAGLLAILTVYVGSWRPNTAAADFCQTESKKFFLAAEKNKTRVASREEIIHVLETYASLFDDTYRDRLASLKNGSLRKKISRREFAKILGQAMGISPTQILRSMEKAGVPDRPVVSEQASRMIYQVAAKKLKKAPEVVWCEKNQKSEHYSIVPAALSGGVASPLPSPPASTAPSAPVSALPAQPSPQTPSYPPTPASAPVPVTVLAPSPILEGDLLARIPACDNPKFTVPITSIDSIQEIAPLGSISPPGHTLPTDHTYVRFHQNETKSDTYPLYAPADMYVFDIGDNIDGLTGKNEYYLRFALCKDVTADFGHVKELEPALLSMYEKIPCNRPNADGACAKRFLLMLPAGTLIGKVGSLQGNFDFGAYDFRTSAGFINPARYSHDPNLTGLERSRVLHAVCPYDLYDEPIRSQFYSKIRRTFEPKCGRYMQDLPGTLQGNWFQGEDTYLAWSANNKNLSFSLGYRDATKAMIAHGGVLLAENKQWEFTPQMTGTWNRQFEDVKVDGKTYCYTRDTAPQERLIVKMLGEERLQIEYQRLDCNRPLEFTASIIYTR